MSHAAAPSLKPPPSTILAYARNYEMAALIALVAIYAVLVLVLGATRSYLGYDAETDYVGAFMPDAVRFLSGEPLRSDLHPPFYSVVIATVYLFVGDWLRAGLIVSWLSGVAVLLSSFFLFFHLCGRPAAWGAVLTLLGSSVFLQYSVQATTDVFYLALFTGSCLLALIALRSGSIPLWAACGGVIGVALMTRTNGVTLLVLLLAPLVAHGSLREKAAGGLALLAGIALPVVALAVYASATGSTLLPARTHENLAITYFATGEHTWSGDLWNQVAGRFDNVFDVLLYDPAWIAKRYLRDLYHVFATHLITIVDQPLFYMFLPGFFFLIGRNLKPAFALFALAVTAQILLVNFKAFEPRFYLFFVPWLGAAVGQMGWTILSAEWPPRVRTAFTALLAAGLLAAVGVASARTYLQTRAITQELVEVVPLLRPELDAGASVMARKPHLAYYTGTESVRLPELANLDELEEHLRSSAPGGPLYIFYGEAERLLRPQYAALATGEAPAWLRVVTRSSRPGDWVLYRYDGAPPTDGDRSERL